MIRSIAAFTLALAFVPFAALADETIVNDGSEDSAIAAARAAVARLARKRRAQS